MRVVTPEDRVGTLVRGKYRLLGVLGKGGMGAVYAAENVALRRPVALKFLLPHLTTDADFVARFVSEARTASALRHPNVVDVLDVDVAEDGSPFLVMERLEGTSLAAHLARRGRLGPHEAWEILAPAMGAVALAHERGVVHRDLKPDNVFLHHVEGGLVPKILDFGIARVEGGLAAGLTGVGDVLGTAAYMAPEQAQGRGVGPWSDVWAMGAIWFEALAGVLPYDFERGVTPNVALVRIVTERARPLSSVAADVPSPIAAVVDAALAHDPSARPPNMRALLELGGRAMREAGESAGRPPFEPSSIVPRGSAPTLIAPSGPRTPAVPTPALPTPALPTPALAPPVAPAPSGPAAKPRSRVVLVVAAIGALTFLALGATALIALLVVGTTVSIEERERTARPIHGEGDRSDAAVIVHAALTSDSRCPEGMAFVDGGQFMMGSPEDQGAEDEHPRPRVTLSAFCMDRTEVRVRAYATCVDAGACPEAPTTIRFPEGWQLTPEQVRQHESWCNGRRQDRGDHPVNCVVWAQAEAYCAWRGALLPTEAQWEFAARGVHGRASPWGSAPLDPSRANTCIGGCSASAVPAIGPDGWRETAPVASFPAGNTPEGISDLVGNVYEWTRDWYGPYHEEWLLDPTGPSTGTQRIIRGGGWRSPDEVDARVQYRHHIRPIETGNDLGFRCVASPAP